MDYDLIPLLTLLEKYPESDVATKLLGFHCSRDDDRESYLHNKAIPMEKRAMSRTYLAVSKEHGIVGYFSIGMKCMGVPDDVPISRNLRRKMNINDETGIAQMYLLGQFARSDDSEPGTGSRLLNDALDIIHGAYIAVGCRVIRVDCADDLIPYYESHGFTFINKNEDKNLNRLVVLID